MTTPAKFELAKLLKEKEFNEPCQFLRVAGKYRINYEKEGDLFDNGMPSTQKPIDWYLAPNIAEVVMWLCEKHGIWISVDTDINGRFRYILRKYNNIDRAWEVKNNISISEYFNSPTEAYEAAIEYTLKNLIL